MNAYEKETSPLYMGIARALCDRDWHISCLCKPLDMGTQRLLDIMHGTLDVPDNFSAKLQKQFGRQAGAWVVAHKRWAGVHGNLRDRR